MDRLFNGSIITLLVCIALNRIILYRADKTLSAEQKITILDLRSKMSYYNCLEFIALAMFFTATYFVLSLGVSHIFLLLVAILLFEIALKFVFVANLKKLNISPSYIKSHIFADIIIVVGFASWIAAQRIR